MGGVTQAEWWSLFEVQLAERMSGGGSAEFVQCLINVIDSGIVSLLRAELERRGLTLDDLAEMRSRTANAEAANSEVEFETSGRYSTHDLTDPARRAVKRLFLAEFDENQIADLLELEAARVLRYIQRFGPDAHEIIRLHKRGRSATQISHELGTARHRVTEMIEAFGQEPIKERTRLTPEQRKSILRLRAEGHGYTAIAREVDCDYYSVRHACRSAARVNAANDAAVDL